MKIDITPLILTFNEKENIARTLEPLSWAARVVIVDSFSDDETVELASGFPNVDVVPRAFDNHTAQWNFGLDQVTTEWVLSLDADYMLTPEFVREISELSPVESISGYSAQFRYCVCGRMLRASVYPPRVVLFRRKCGRYHDDGHTQLLEIDGVVAPLQSKIEHDDRKPLRRWLRSQDAYSKLEARHLLSRPVKQLNAQDKLRRGIFFAAPAMFLYLMFVRGLIFDGWRGWFYVAQRTMAELLLSMRLLRQGHQLD